MSALFWALLILAGVARTIFDRAKVKGQVDVVYLNCGLSPVILLQTNHLVGVLGL